MEDESIRLLLKITAYFIVVGVLLYLLNHYVFRQTDDSETGEDKAHGPYPDVRLPEWPIVYRTYDSAEIQTFRTSLESEGIETVLDHEAAGSFDDGTAIKLALRVHPDRADEASTLVQKWGGSSEAKDD